MRSPKTDPCRYIYRTIQYYLVVSHCLLVCVTDNISHHQEFVDKLLSAGKFSDTLPHYQEAINNDPSNHSIYFKRATVFLALNRPNSAMDDLNKAIELNPKFTSALSQRANLHVKLGNLDEAHNDHEQYLKLEPNDGDTLMSLSRVERLRKDVKSVRDRIQDFQFEAALKLLEPLIENMPYNNELLKLRVKAQEKIEEARRPKKRSKNYASGECAKVIESNPEAKKSSHIINELIDEYMLNPCKAKIWFVIELCDSIQATLIEIANYELYSSTPKDLTVYFSDTYPASDWKPIGHFTAADSRTLQAFNLEQVGFGKFIRVELHSHYSNEHYCVISEVKVYGASMMDDYLVDEDQTIKDNNATQRVPRLKRKISAYKVYRNMMVEPYICGLTLETLSDTSSAQNVTSKQPFQFLKEQPVMKPILPQPTQQPVVNNRTAPLKPSIFVELGNKVKTLEASLKSQIEDIERRLNEKNELVRRTEAKVDKLKLQFESFALIVIAYYVYKLMLDLM